MLGGPPTHLMWSNMYGPEKPRPKRPVDWRRVAAFFLPYWKEETLVMLGILIGSALGIAPALFTRDLIDRALAQQILKAGAAERAVGVASDKNFAVERFKTLICRGAPGALLQCPQLVCFRKQPAVAREIGKVRGEDDMHVGDRPPRAPRRFKRTAAPFEKARGGTCAAMKRKRN